MKINRRKFSGILASLVLAGCYGDMSRQFPNIEKSRFLDIKSFEEAEQKLRQYAINGGEGEIEKFWFSDGKVWVDLRVRSSQNSVQKERKLRDEFIKKSKGNTVYFYHQHKALYLDEGITDGIAKHYYGINPPKSTDFLTQLLIKRSTNNHGKNLTSRIVDPWGVWEFDFEDRIDIPTEEKIISSSYSASDCIEESFVYELGKTLEKYQNIPFNEQAEKLKPIYEKQGAEISYRIFE